MPGKRGVVHVWFNLSDPGVEEQADTVRLRVTKVLVAAAEQALGRLLRLTLRRMGFRHILNVWSAREVIQQRQGRYGVV